MDPIRPTLAVSASGLAAQKARIEAATANIANIQTTRTADGGPYRRHEVVLGSSSGFNRALQQAQVVVEEIRQANEPPRLVYDPGHPDAGADGLVAMPAIDLAVEMADLADARAAYEANITAINAGKRLQIKSLDIGR